MIKFLIEDGLQLYTVQSGALVAVSGPLTASTFQSNGFDSVENIGTLLTTLTSPKVYSWSDEQEFGMTARLQGLPLPQDIIVDNTGTLADVVGVESITATYSGSPLVAINVDNSGWIYYNDNDEQWEPAAAHEGMSIATMQSISSADWSTLVTGASTIYLRFTLTTASDSLNEFRIEFTVN